MWEKFWMALWFSLAGFGMLLGQISFMIGKKMIEVSKETSPKNNFSIKTKNKKFSSIELIE